MSLITEFTSECVFAPIITLIHQVLGHLALENLRFHLISIFFVHFQPCFANEVAFVVQDWRVEE